MAVKWTAAQREGIETVSHSLLVSAAAGSGKTSVLAERCAHLVCDAADRCGIDELLVVTFTEAAAAEMKSRIHRALIDRHAKSPSDYTARQLAIIDRAHVGTLHGFCARLLRQHFHLLGIDPDFVIIDADEASLLKLEVARDLFADRYDQGSEDFRNFVDCYGDGNDERLIRAVLKAHDTLCSVEDPAGWLNQAQSRIHQAIELPLVESEMGREFIAIVRRNLNALRTHCVNAANAVKALRYFEVYVAHLRELYSILNHWVKVLASHGIDGLVEEANLEKFPELPRLVGDMNNKDLAKGWVNTVRKAMKEGPWRQCVKFTEAQWKDGLKRTLPHTQVFLSLVDEFALRYTAAKQEEGALDFADLERYTLAVLRNSETGELAPSSVARSYHHQFRHVLVDEYQDINQVQDAILSLISHECIADRPRVTPNLFCVGDVKQSIYRFRLAEAQRFLDRRRQYTREGSHGKLIDLQQNFRSRAPLLDAINGVFGKLMTSDAADLNYDESQELKAGLEFPDANGNRCFSGSPIELNLLNSEDAVAAATDDDSEDVDMDRTAREATLLARRILEMTDRTGEPPMCVIDRTGPQPIPRPVRFGDIVILLRSMQYKGDSIANVLRAAGIAVHNESASGYFEATEINDVLSLLQVLDNQRQDIPLAAFLRSPLANLPEPEENLARIRLAYTSDTAPVPFHQAVVNYAKEQTDELAATLRDLLNQLDVWRRQARRRPLAELLWMIYDQTGYLAFCAGLPSGEQRQANLIELHERARQFGTFRRQGLGRFLQFLDKLKTEQDLGQAAIASEAEDVVRIMTIHRSKGQEFPIVLIPDLGKIINMQDCQGSILLDRKAGLGLSVVDLERQIKYPSLASTVVQQRIRQQTLAEELRVLYVAMTRAKEHLVLVGSCRQNSQEKWTSQWAAHQGALPADVVLSARTMLDWLGPAAAALKGSSPQGPLHVREISADDIAAWTAKQAHAPAMTPHQLALAELKPLTPPPPPSELANEVIDRLDTVYRFQRFAHLAATQSATSRSKGQTMTTTAGSSESSPPQLDRILPKPAFLAGELPPDAADRGTATHAVLEHLDFSTATDAASIWQQIEQMQKSGRISETQAKCVDVGTIEWLMSTDVGQLLRDNVAGLMRELPVYYAIAADATDSTRSDDPLDQQMIRGRLDVLVPRGNDLVIVDYKTDQVSGEVLEARTKFYEPQLALYRDAIEKITKKKVVETVIVFLQAKQVRMARS
jgi:ATP-dependent helicase/nuclease subunit A